MTDPVSLRELVSALRVAADGRKSATFFITTDQQHSAMITFSRGSITGLKYRSMRGYAAASALAKVTGVKYQSAAEPIELPGEVELSTRAVLEILDTGDTGAVPAEPAGGAIPVDLDALRARYVAAIGPIGAALLDEAVDDLGDSLAAPGGVERLIEKLVDQIDDEAEAVSFVRDVRAGL